MKNRLDALRDNNWNDTDVEKHWDRVSKIYIRENEKLKYAHDQRFTEAIKFLDLKPNLKILNISSRDCEANDYIRNQDQTARVVNAEISQGLINEAARVRPYVKQVKIDNYSSLPFTSAEFDRVLCLETLEHVASPVNFLKELRRISTQEVVMILSCPPGTSELPYRLFSFFFGGHGEGPHRFLPSKEVKLLLRHTGWKLKDHKGTVLIPVGPIFIQKWGEWIIRHLQRTFISELGIRQFYVCTKV
jgi:2-polyprenyl-3-methyl-5-hydroxy-6-metoxy-1,4-benzoquinol methylase